MALIFSVDLIRWLEEKRDFSKTMMEQCRREKAQEAEFFDGCAQAYEAVISHIREKMNAQK